MLKIERVVLTPADAALCLSIATQRWACKRNPESRLSKTHSGFGVHFGGVVGEMCFTRVYGGAVSQSILPGGDHHAADVALPDGRKVEVKTRLITIAHPDMIFEPGELDKFSWVSLVQVFLPDVGLVYPIYSSDEVRMRWVETSYGYGRRMAFNPHGIAGRDYTPQTPTTSPLRAPRPLPGASGW